MPEDKKDFPSLISQLENRDSFLRKEAARALGELGDSRAIEPLVNALGDQNLDVRASARRALEKHADDKLTVELLIKTLKDKRVWVRDEATYLLSEIGDERAVEPLMEVIDTGHSEYARRGLRRLADTRAAEPYIKALKSPDPDVRRIAARTLGFLQDKRAIEPLMEASQDDDRKVRYSAMFALGSFNDQGTIELSIRALKHQDSDIRFVAAYNLGRFQDKRAVEPLIEALQDDSGKVQYQAAKSLGELGEKSAIEPLYSYWVNGGSAIDALAKLGDVRVLPHLIEDLKDTYEGHEPRRWEAAIALGKLGDIRAVDPLVEILQDSNWQVCDIIKYAAIALGKIGDSRAIEPLAEAFEKEITYDEGWAEWEIEEERFYRRSHIAGAFCLLGDNTKLAVVIEGLNSSDNDIRYTAVQVLAECGDKRSLEVLEQQLKVENDLMIRLAIGDVLEKFRIDPLEQNQRG